MASISPNAKQQFFTNAGAPAAGCKLYTYATGTSTPLATYTDQAGTVLNSNPIVLDARGEAVMYLLAQQYRYVLHDSLDAPIWGPRENIEAGVGVSTLSSSGASQGAALVGFLQLGTGGIGRTVANKLLEFPVSPEDYGAVGDGVTDDTTAINRAIAYLASIKGGTLKFGPKTYLVTSTILIQDSNILLEGRGSDTGHDGGTGAAPITIIKWGGASFGTVLSFSTPNLTSAAMRCRVGAKQIAIDGNLTANTGLQVMSIRYGTFEDIYVTRTVQRGYYVSSWIRAGMSEATDTQHCRFTRCSWKLLDSASNSANGFWLTSEAPFTAGANTSFNIWEACTGQTVNGFGFYMIDADNNNFLSCSNFATGTGFGVLLSGAYSNYFYGCSLTVRGFGVASGQTNPGPGNCFINVDEANSIPYPTLDSDVTVQWHGSYRGYQRTTTAIASFAQTSTSALAQLANIGNNTLIVHNTSQSGIAQTNGSFTYTWSQDASNNYRLTGSASGGVLDLTQGTTVSAKLSKVGFNNTAPIAKPTVTGAKGSNAALGSLMTALAAYGLVTDSTTT